MSLGSLARAIEGTSYKVISTDLFDTLLLRDHTIESARFETASRRAAARLGVDPSVLTRLRWSAHDNAYRAVAIQGSGGDAALSSISETVATAFGLGQEEARTMHEMEVDVDIHHLRPNRPLLALLDQATRRGKRVIAVSDTYYNEVDLRRILSAVVGDNPIRAFYSSADRGLSKYAGSIFEEVTRREGVAPERILHLGDNVAADVMMARAASWSAIHLPRSRRYQLMKRGSRVLGLSTKVRRVR